MWIFLLVLLALIVAATVLTEVERFGWATVLLIVGVVVAQIFHVADLLGWVKAHGAATIVYTLSYVGAGVLWSFIKWFSFLMAFREKFRAYKAEFMRAQMPPLDQIPEDRQRNFQIFLTNQYDSFYGNSFTTRPRAAKNKTRIVSWMSLWPCSVIGTVLNDPVRRLFTFLFTWFKSLYQAMSDRIFAKDVELK